MTRTQHCVRVSTVDKSFLRSILTLAAARTCDTSVRPGPETRNSQQNSSRNEPCSQSCATYCKAPESTSSRPSVHSTQFAAVAGSRAGQQRRRLQSAQTCVFWWQLTHVPSTSRNWPTGQLNSCVWGHRKTTTLAQCVREHVVFSAARTAMQMRLKLARNLGTNLAFRISS